MAVELVHFHDICLYPPPWTAHFGGWDEVYEMCSEVFLRACFALLTALVVLCSLRELLLSMRCRGAA